MKLSIIVPVYNVESYIRECLYSIAAQTYRDFECIIINDGSTDKSAEVCVDYILRDNRFRLLSQPNKGLAMARKVALSEAKGEYIGFVDADDYVAKDMFYFLMETAINNNADIVICDWVRIGEKGKEENRQYEVDTRLSKELALKDLAADHIKSYMWNKIFKRTLLRNSLSLSKTKMMEDYSCMHHIFVKANSFYYIAKYLYYYRYRPESIMGAASLLHRLQGYAIARARYEFYQFNYPQMSVESKIGLFPHAWVLCKNYACPKEQEAKDIYLNADNFIKSFFREYIGYKKVGKKERLSLWLYAYFTKSVRTWKLLKYRRKIEC
jgi:glycosyltransferase involved in cell wall biosynthesis